jgi:hypothetical protein
MVSSWEGRTALVVAPGHDFHGALVRAQVNVIRLAVIEPTRFAPQPAGPLYKTADIYVREVSVGDRRFTVACGQDTPTTTIVLALIDAEPATIRDIEVTRA